MTAKDNRRVNEEPGAGGLLDDPDFLKVVNRAFRRRPL
jgi:hypothetical protein